ncbi:MAG: 2-hydroxychromene-2-carboxylate isomerase [Myxococcota bacterium]
MVDLEFYYDVVCPYAYLASAQVEAVAKRQGARVRWRPILLGGLLREVGAPDDPNVGMSAAKVEIQALDRQRWAVRLGVPLVTPPEHPRRTVNAMRLCLAAPEGERRVALSHDVFAAYWARGEDVTDAQVLDAIAVRHGLEAGAYRAPELKAALREATAAAAGRGAFGVPSFVVGDTLWWGQDRLGFVEEVLGGQPERLPTAPESSSARAGRLTFFHDFASPFSYLASTQIESLAAARGLEVEYVPILLGALFRDIGTPNVPLLEMNETKQAYVRRDLDDWAAWWGVPFAFPEHFPLRSVLPLRVALVKPSLTPMLYRAIWAEGRRVDTPETLGPLLEEAGESAASLLAAAVEPENKARLRENTERAETLGVCGVPTMQVQRGGDSVLVWGQDRLGLLASLIDGG